METESSAQEAAAEQQEWKTIHGDLNNKLETADRAFQNLPTAIASKVFPNMRGESDIFVGEAGEEDDTSLRAPIAPHRNGRGEFGIRFDVDYLPKDRRLALEVLTKGQVDMKKRSVDSILVWRPRDGAINLEVELAHPDERALENIWVSARISPKGSIDTSKSEAGAPNKTDLKAIAALAGKYVDRATEQIKIAVESNRKI